MKTKQTTGGLNSRSFSPGTFILRFLYFHVIILLVEQICYCIFCITLTWDGSNAVPEQVYR